MYVCIHVPRYISSNSYGLTRICLDGFRNGGFNGSLRKVNVYAIGSV